MSIIDRFRQLPTQVPYIIGNEACERFSFYGMRNILVAFLSTTLLAALGPDQAKVAAKEAFHIFVLGVYFFPLLGGFIADRWLGKYATILWVSVLYCIGQGILVLATMGNVNDAAMTGLLSGFDRLDLFFAGLFLIALGSGGIKPCVSSFVGDQFTREQSGLAKLVFEAFYWSINLGSLFASLFVPALLRSYGPTIAFGVPGVLMAIATVVFWAGSRHYVKVPPAPADPHGFWRVAWHAATSHWSGIALLAVGLGVVVVAGWFRASLGNVAAICTGLVGLLAVFGIAAYVHLDRVKARHPTEAIQGVAAVLKLLVLFGFITPFWSLFDQKASTWVLQADNMVKPEWFAPSQMQALNPLLVMLLIPFNNLVLYPALARIGVVLSSLQKMTIGIALAGIAYVIVAAFQFTMAGGAPLSITWQILPYVFLTMGEVLVSATGLEFAYAQAPLQMKSTIMSFWSLSVTVGNLWVLLVGRTVQQAEVIAWLKSNGLDPVGSQMVFFALFAFVAAAAFFTVARRYTVVDRYHGTT
jgi:proton-dependent oligopeptide transporter, POT family